MAWLTTTSSSLGSSEDDDIEAPSGAFVSPSKALVADVDREDEICNKENVRGA